MGYERDAAKGAANLRKHGVGFRIAAEIFGSFRLVREDTRRDYGEQRFIALGEYGGEILRVVFTVRGDYIRIISAWKAGRHDRQTYSKARGTREV